ncbi:hypothetical protein [Streptomyces sp. MNP-20]|nr:hypothetical protein [Streptomyces sp. MNP-20]
MDEMGDEFGIGRLGEQHRALLEEVAELLDIEAGLAAIISDPPDTP